MRFIEILLEYKRDITKQKLGDQLVAAAKRDRNQDIDTILTDLEQMDPTANKQYMVWLANQYIKQLFRLEDRDRVKDVLEKFIRAKSRLSEKDINRYTFHTLEAAMDKIYNVELAPQSATSGTFEVPPSLKAEVLYNGPLGLLAVPKNHKASCYLGKGTKWCTAMSGNPGLFTQYSREAPLYIWRDKNGEKYQFHFAKYYQFKDKLDKDLSKKTLRYLTTQNPILKKLFNLGINQWFKTYIIDDLQKNQGLDPELIENFIQLARNLGMPIQNFLPVLKNYPLAMAYFVKYFTDDQNVGTSRLPWIEKDLFSIDSLEAILSTKEPHGSWIVEYATKYIKERIPELEKALLDNIEKGPSDQEDFKDILYVSNKSAAALYAQNIIKGNWPELEPHLLRKGRKALGYYIHGIRRRVSPELEKEIAKDGEFSLAYAKRLRRKFPEGESKIAQDAIDSLVYAREVVKDKWPPGEKALLSRGDDSYWLEEYNKFIKSKGWPPIRRPVKTSKKKVKKKAKKKATRR